jgi:hypothetical protein
MLKTLANKFLDIVGSKHWEPATKDGALVMRRRLPGRWEYRAPTVEEMDEEIKWQAIK